MTHEPGDSREVARRTSQIARCAALACIGLSVLLVLHQSPPPPLEITPEAASLAETKMTTFRAAANPGHPRVLRLGEAELNAWLSTNLVMQPSAGDRPDGPESTIRDLRVQLLDSEIRLYVVFEYRGKDFSMELQGRLLAEDGYVGLDPTTGKLGALPLPAPALRSAVRQVTGSAENREKLRLPLEVQDIRVERRELVVTAR